MPDRELVRYYTIVQDSARWNGFKFRDDDIVISTPPKAGTTWMQTLCEMLVFDDVELRQPLASISPWLDMQTNDLGRVVTALEAQQHRRVIKTHTPLDGVPFVEGVTYVCVARDPRDIAVSFQHHWSNLDHEAFIAARARAVGLGDLEELGPPPFLPDDALEQFRMWVDAAPGTFIGPALSDVLHHVQTFWDRRHLPGVGLFHYNDLMVDLPAQVRRLADLLSVDPSEERISEFCAAATFANMKARADELAPDSHNRIWRSNSDFFHRGTTGQWRELISPDDDARYERRVRELVAPEIAAWAHLGWCGSAGTE
jgi:hypothetical protein